MQPCTLEDTPVGTYVYNIFAVQRTVIDEHFYTCNKVYLNPHVHDPQEPMRFLALKLSDIEK